MPHPLSIYNDADHILSSLDPHSSPRHSSLLPRRRDSPSCLESERIGGNPSYGLQGRRAGCRHLGTPLLSFSEYLNSPASYLANPATSFDPGKPESSPSETRFGPRHCQRGNPSPKAKSAAAAHRRGRRGAPLHLVPSMMSGRPRRWATVAT
jgi:hypothetical protein